MFFVVLLFVGELLSFRKISFYRVPYIEKKHPCFTGQERFFLLLFYMNILYI